MKRRQAGYERACNLTRRWCCRRRLLSGAALLATLLAAASLGAQPPSPWPKLQEVIVVSKTHFDIGYTDLASKVVDRYRTTMADQALALVDESRGLPPEQQFSWTLAGWPMAQILWPGQTPQRRERFLAAMRAGRLIPQALPFTTHTESLDLEDLARGLVFSVEMARAAGQPLPTSAKMTDVTSHCSATATVLARGGVKFFHLGCNSGCSHPDVPPLYWWEGPDGSRVLTVLSSSYGTELRPPPGWPHRAWLCMWMTGDNHGPPNADEVRRLFEQAKKELPGVRVRFGGMSDFAEAILRENPKLPVVRGDMPDTWIHGIGSMPIETQKAHAVRPRIAALESLDTLLGVWGVRRQSAAPIVREAYENTLLFGEHTWGPDVGRYAGYRYGDDWKKRLAEGHYRFLLEGFDQKRAYAHKAAALVEPAIAARISALADAMNVPGRRVVVYNPLAWTRDGAMDLPVNGEVNGLTDVATGRATPFSVADGRLRFVARDLPPLGYKTYALRGVGQDRRVGRATASPTGGQSEIRISKSETNRKLETPNPKLHVADRQGLALQVDRAAGRMENEFFRVTLDPARCGVRSIVDKRTGRELVDPKSPYALGQYLYERLDADQNAAFTKAYVTAPDSGEMISHGKPNLPSAKVQPYAAATATDATLAIRCDAVSATATMRAAVRGILRDPVSLCVRLDMGVPAVDLTWSIERKTPDPWPEAGWLCFPIKAPSPRFKLARLGTLVDPAKDLVRGSNHEIFCLNGGVTVAGAEGGTTGLCPVDAQLISLGRPGLWRYTREYTPREPLVLVNLFNNVYSTNFAQWIEGSWSSRVRLWSVEPNRSADESLVTNSWEARTDSLAGMSNAPAGSLPPSACGVDVAPATNDAANSLPSGAGRAAARGLLVTALGPNPYGPGTLLRLWEQAGRAGDFTITLPQQMKIASVQSCDLRGQPLGPPKPLDADHTLRVAIHPLAPASYILLGPGENKAGKVDK